MKDFSANSVNFIVRVKENRKYIELDNLMSQDTDSDLDSPVLIKDCIVNLYTGVAVTTNKGTVRHKETIIEEPFLLIITKSKDDTNKQFWFITNGF